MLFINYVQAAAAGPLSSPTTYQVEPYNNLYFVQNLSEQAYIPYQIDRDPKHPQRPRVEEQESFRWSVKDFPMPPYGVAFKQQSGAPDSSYYPHYASFYSKGHIHTHYTPGSDSVPGAADWGTYYREDTTRDLANAAAATSIVNGSWPNSDSNASASSAHSNSPVTPL